MGGGVLVLYCGGESGIGIGEGKKKKGTNRKHDLGNAGIPSKKANRKERNKRKVAKRR